MTWRTRWGSASVEQAQGPDAGVVDEDIQTAEAALRGLDRRRADGRVGDVAGDALRPAPCGGDLGGQFFESFPAAGGDYHLGPLPGEFPGDFPADAAGGPGDDGTGSANFTFHWARD